MLDPAGHRPLAEQINERLPQTQCRRCGYDACLPYAEAIAEGKADINRCPPGGAQGIEVLARLTGREVIPLDPECGLEGPFQVAVIDPERCIGCLLCIKACPVDAIVGAFKRLHTVVEQDCTGCELCIPACPVDCISLESPSQSAGPDGWTTLNAQRSRLRYEHRQLRLQQDSSPSEPTEDGDEPVTSPAPDLLAEAMRRARERRMATPKP